MNLKTVPIADHIRTSYVRGGGTRIGGRVPRGDEVLTVGQAGRDNFRATPRVAHRIAALDEDVRQAGGEPLRLTEASRDLEVQARARAGYDLWVRAGKPEPGSRHWVRQMKNAYAARPGESNHGWGGAIDIDVEALQFPGTERGSDQALAMFWGLAERHGFSPIIAHPVVAQSESWHFDCLGPLHNVYTMFTHSEDAKHLHPYTATALTGCALMRTLPLSLERITERYIQARLLIGGFFCGNPDGFLGPKTRAALKQAGMKQVHSTTPKGVILAYLHEAKIGTAEMEAL